MNLEMVVSVVWVMLIVFTIITALLIVGDMENLYRTRQYDVVIWVVILLIPVSGLVLDVLVLTLHPLPGYKVVLVSISIGVFVIGILISALQAWKLAAQRQYQTPEEVKRSERDFIEKVLENHKQQSQTKGLS